MAPLFLKTGGPTNEGRSSGATSPTCNPERATMPVKPLAADKIKVC